jgi:hypothetical protein
VSCFVDGVVDNRFGHIVFGGEVVELTTLGNPGMFGY